MGLGREVVEMKQRVVLGCGGGIGGEYGRIVDGEVEGGGGRASRKVEEVEKLRRGIECLMMRMVMLMIEIEVLHQVCVVVVINIIVFVKLLLLLLLNVQLQLLLQFFRHDGIASGGDKCFLSGIARVGEVLHGQIREMYAL